MKLKNVFTLVIATCIAFSCTATVFAQNYTTEKKGVVKFPQEYFDETMRVSVGDAAFADVGADQLLKLNELASFSSQEDADKAIEQLELEIENAENLIVPYQTQTTNANVPIRSASVEYEDEYCVDEENLSFNMHIKLNVLYHYTVSSAGQVAITRYSPHTSFTGFTYGFGWDEHYCDAWLTNGGNSISAEAGGELIWYFLVNGFLEAYRSDIDLSGTVYVI